MYWSRLFQGFSIATVLAIATTLPMGSARAESVFAPYQEAIQEQIPVGLSVRLPEKILLTATEQQNLDSYTVRVFVSQNPSRFTLSLYGCETGSQPCLLGSFITENANSQFAQDELARHTSQGERITLQNGVFGYVLNSDQPDSPTAFATMMWQQENMIHALSFPQNERQNMMFMAVSMAKSDSLFRP